MSSIAEKLSNVIYRATGGFPGGPKIIPMAWVINLHKGLSGLFIILLMVFYNNYSISAWVYLLLHGSYGLFWITKHLYFRDNRWEIKLTAGGGIIVFIMLGTYWIAPYLLISSTNQNPGTILILLFASATYSLGLFLMLASDFQKHKQLLHEKKLITTGYFKYIRHPNYLGEMMVYGSFAWVSGHWLPWLILFFWWICIFWVNMVQIEKSLSRYPEWRMYHQRTNMLLPWKLFFSQKRTYT